MAGLTALASAITGLYVIYGSSSNIQCDKGYPGVYTRVDVDLNKGAGGDYIYLCFTRNPDWPGTPVTDIYVWSGNSANPYFPLGYILLNVDLNKGAGGKHIYLSYSTSGQRAITGIDAIHGHSRNIPVRPGWTKDNQDLNEGAGGSFIYFIYKY